MSIPPKPEDDPLPSTDGDSFFERLQRRIARIQAFEIRNAWWDLLNAWEAKRTLRRTVYVGAVFAVGAGAAIFWGYPKWRQRTSLSMARQWLEAGRLDQAALAIDQAVKVAPERIETWQLAASLARLSGHEARAIDYTRKAAALAPGNTDITLAWAADALLANQQDEAEKALATLSSDTFEHSPYAQRLSGEIARRRMDYTVARDRFSAALKLDGPVAIDEVPLGSILLKARDVEERQRGLGLLAKWAPDPAWGATSLRILLDDALAQDDHAAMLKWADALRAHPRCTLGDLPQCLLALSKADEGRFATVLVIMEKDHAKTTGAIAQLVGWLNQIGRSRDALQWVRTLPETLTRQPPAVVVIAEALRLNEDWGALRSWTRDGNWSKDLEYLHLSYALNAALKLGENERAKELRTTLEAQAPGYGGQTLFAASTLYAWGLKEPALSLLWIAADQQGSSVEALATLARHYQTERDANGQFRVFRKWRALRSQDEDIGNNFAFFAVLTGQDAIAAEDVARSNFQRTPSNPVFRTTYAFVLTRQNRNSEALTILRPLITNWRESSAVAFVYGLALADNGQKAEARTVLATLDRSTLTRQETVLVDAGMK